MSKGGPKRFSSPPVVTLLRLAQLGVPGAVKGLEQCLDTSNHEIRTFGALALAAYQRPRADDYLAQELTTAPDSGIRENVAEFLLDLGD